MAGMSAVSGTESAVLYRGRWWRAIDGEPVEVPFDTQEDAERVIWRLAALRRGRAMRIQAERAR
jgi:hypothetical protein